MHSQNSLNLKNHKNKKFKFLNLKNFILQRKLGIKLKSLFLRISLRRSFILNSPNARQDHLVKILIFLWCPKNYLKIYIHIYKILVSHFKSNFTLQLFVDIFFIIFVFSISFHSKCSLWSIFCLTAIKLLYPFHIY